MALANGQLGWLGLATNREEEGEKEQDLAAALDCPVSFQWERHFPFSHGVMATSCLVLAVGGGLVAPSWAFAQALKSPRLPLVGFRQIPFPSIILSTTLMSHNICESMT